MIGDVEALDGYLTSLGLRREHDRLSQLLGRLREIESARQRGTLEALELRPDVEELVWSLVEGQEFAEIYRGIEGYDPKTVKKLMQKALQGPLDPGRETPTDGSNLGRNTAFELRLGAGFRRAGAAVTLGEQADLRVEHAGVHIYIECKRPFYEHTIRTNISKGLEQLRDRFARDSHPLTIGLVAVSVSKTLNAGSRWFVADEEAGLQNLSEDSKRLYEEYSVDLRNSLDPRVVGIIYHIFTPAYVRQQLLLTAVSQADVFLRGWAMKDRFRVSSDDAVRDLIRKALGPQIG